MYIDFHTHILPDIDDGSESIEMSLEMLRIANENGAKTVILTPHIDATSDFDEFLQIRNEKFEALKKAIKKSRQKCPKLLLGAEVMLDCPLSEMENIRSLCIEGTELLLLELPYTQWNSWYKREIHNIITNHGVIPVLAHIERYMTSPKDIEKLEPLASMGAKFQINASSFLSFSGRRIIKALAPSGFISAIASDAHNLSNRSADISRALSTFKKKLSPDFTDYLYEKTCELLKNYSCK